MTSTPRRESAPDEVPEETGGPAAATTSATRDPSQTIRKDTIPDAKLAANALLDRLVPSDGRAQPPRAMVKQSASSGGAAFVAYSGEGKPARANAPNEPVEAVVVLKQLGEIALAAGVSEADTVGGLRRGETTAMGRRQTTSNALLVAGGICTGLVIVGVGLWFITRSTAENAGAPPPGAVATTAAAPGVPSPAAAPPPAPPAATVVAPTPIPVRSVEPPLASPSPVKPAPSVVDHSSAHPAVSPRPVAPPEPKRRGDIDPGTTPF
jgi:hypothetical protein